MTIRTQRYIIEPAGACPSHLAGPGGRPPATVPLDIDNVSRCAWGEILQTAPRATSLFAFLEDLLEPGASLTWREHGPGRGTEMRRAFSGLFGRFFARAYLQEHHGFVWFTAIDGDNFRLSASWRVRRKDGSSTEMPDWICARPGELAIAEAKGSHQRGNATRGGMPGPIKTADGQITGVLVEKRSVATRGGPPTWTAKTVKGWAVMSRWGLAASGRDPFLYVLDPRTDGEPLDPKETKSLVQAVAQAHVRQTAEGLGLLKPDADAGLVAPGARRRVRVAGDASGRHFLGGFITPFGLLDLDLAQAKELSGRLPDARTVQFVGLDEALFEDLLQNRSIASTETERIGEGAIIGSDGLLIGAPADIIDEGPQGLNS